MDSSNQTDSTSHYFTIFLTNLSSSVWLATTAAHSLDATDSAWFCERATSYNSARIKPDLETFQQPFFFITCFLLLLPLYLLLFPPLHHFHPRSAFVDSCPERECAVCVRLCAILLHFHIFLTGFWIGGVGFACCTGSATGELPRAGEVLLYYSFLADANESNLIIILLKEARQNRFALAQQKPKYMRFRHKYIRGVGVPLKGTLGRKSLMALGSVINM